MERKFVTERKLRNPGSENNFQKLEKHPTWKSLGSGVPFIVTGSWDNVPYSVRYIRIGSRCGSVFFRNTLILFYEKAYKKSKKEDTFRYPLCWKIHSFIE